MVTREPERPESDPLGWVMAGLYLFGIAANAWVVYQQLKAEQDMVAPWKSEVAKAERAQKLRELRRRVEGARDRAVEWWRLKLDAHRMHHEATVVVRDGFYRADADAEVRTDADG